MQSVIDFLLSNLIIVFIVVVYILSRIKIKPNPNSSDRPNIPTSQNPPRPFPDRTQSGEERPFPRNAQRDSQRPFPGRAQSDGQHPFPEHAQSDGQHPFPGQAQSQTDRTFPRHRPSEWNQPFPGRSENPFEWPLPNTQSRGNQPYPDPMEQKFGRPSLERSDEEHFSQIRGERSFPEVEKSSLPVRTQRSFPVSDNSVFDQDGHEDLTLDSDPNLMIDQSSATLEEGIESNIDSAPYQRPNKKPYSSHTSGRETSNADLPRRALEGMMWSQIYGPPRSKTPFQYRKYKRQ